MSSTVTRRMTKSGRIRNQTAKWCVDLGKDPLPLKMLQVRAAAKLVHDIDEWRIRQGLPVLVSAEAVRKLLQRALYDGTRTRDIPGD
jgi:hypothetical protein